MSDRPEGEVPELEAVPDLPDAAEHTDDGSLLEDVLLLLNARKRARAWGELLLAALVSFIAAAALTWPTVLHLDEVLLGGGELGGWLWRQWWHFSEVEAVAHEELGLIGSTEMLLGLGRYPETGNILDILLLSYPLDQMVGFPAHHNLKILVILVGNGICGYALARSFTRSPLIALVAGTVAVLNPLVVQDINKIGLRQVLLWWMLLYPVFLARAQRTGRPWDGVMAGVMLVLVAAFYWFYGLFAGMFTIIHLAGWWLRTRTGPISAARWLGPMTATVLIGALVFLSPYLSKGEDDQTGQGGTARLPEVTLFVPYPAYDTIAQAPLRPSNYRENVLSSLHRGIDSAWPADTVLNPSHGAQAWPIIVFFMGVLPAFFIKGGRTWLVVWLVFWLGTMGPFLKLGSGRDTAEVVMLGDYVVRLPYAWMFQYIPGMSRMFAPYRMAAMVVVAGVVLLSLSLEQLQGWRRIVLPGLAGVALALQPFYRFDLGPVGNGGRPEMWRVPTQVSQLTLPQWYEELDPKEWKGIIELPLEQQQDLLAAYQAFHRRKVYRSWATLPAIPPLFRKSGGGEPGRRMRWLASPEPNRDPVSEVFRELSRDPLEADLTQLQPEQLERVLQSGDYRYIVVHERGFFLVRPQEGATVYRTVVRRLAEVLGVEPTEHVEQEAHDWPGKERSFPAGPAWVPWASQEVQLPSQEMPERYLMSVFDLEDWAPRPEPEEGAEEGATPEEAPMGTETSSP